MAVLPGTPSGCMTNHFYSYWSYSPGGEHAEIGSYRLAAAVRGALNRPGFYLLVVTSQNKLLTLTLVSGDKENILCYSMSM